MKHQSHTGQEERFAVPLGTHDLRCRCLLVAAGGQAAMPHTAPPWRSQTASNRCAGCPAPIKQNDCAPVAT